MALYNWGILSTGSIAHTFADDLRRLPNARMVAVGSRSQESADEFGDEFDIPHRYASYEALVNDPDVDVIYIATPHSLHAEDTSLALNAGKHVLCEKPFTLSRAQAEPVMVLAKEKGLFLMEAMWTRFLPAMQAIQKRVAEGEIGDLRLIRADLGFRQEFDPQSRLFNPDLGGGALLDVGIYPITCTAIFWGSAPERIDGHAALAPTGVDELDTISLQYSDGRLAQLTCAVALVTPSEADLFGTEGRIHIHSPFNKTQVFTLYDNQGNETTHDHSFEGGGLRFQAEHMMKMLDLGRVESDVMPHDETLRVLGIMDTLRAQWGIVYPDEK